MIMLKPHLFKELFVIFPAAPGIKFLEQHNVVQGSMTISIEHIDSFLFITSRFTNLGQTGKELVNWFMLNGSYLLRLI